MKEYHISVDDAAALFYEQVGRKANMPPEKIMAKALFKLAGQISAEAISARNEKQNCKNLLKYCCKKFCSAL